MAYKELILPQKLNVEEKTLSASYAKFVAEPYERGYGQTIGNALRRILLSSLDGAAVSAVRVAKASHEYAALPGVREDVMNILLNLKKARFKMFTNGPEMIYLAASKPGPVTAGMIQGNSNIEVVNPDLVLAHLEPGGKLDMEIEISKGRGYASAEEIRARQEWPSGFLPVDALFSPIVKVHYDVENARVGQVTDYDRLILEIWTDGSINPVEALLQSAKLMREALNIFLPEEEVQAEEAAEAVAVPAGAGDGKLQELLGRSIDAIELSVRASNCLKVAKIRTIGELVTKNEEELLGVKNFGQKSLEEIKDRLKDMGLSLGMRAA